MICSRLCNNNNRVNQFVLMLDTCSDRTEIGARGADGKRKVDQMKAFETVLTPSR